MQDIATLVQIVLFTGAIVAPAVLLARLTAGAERVSLGSILTAPDHGAWPRGVQEEEPVRWRTGYSVARSAAS